MEKWKPGLFEGVYCKTVEQFEELSTLAKECGFTSILTISGRQINMPFVWTNAWGFTELSRCDYQLSIEGFKQKLTQHLPKMEKYEFKEGEGCVCKSIEERLELVKLADKFGYNLSEPLNSNYWTRGIPNIGWNRDEFFECWDLKITHSYDEMKRLLTGNKTETIMNNNENTTFPEKWRYKNTNRDGFEKFIRKVKTRISTNGWLGNGTDHYYYFNNIDGLGMSNSKFSLGMDNLEQYVEVTLEQLNKHYLNTKQMKTNETIIIPMEILGNGIIAMNSEQRSKFLPKVNLVTGECNKEDLIGCYNNICAEWKSKLEGAFPWLKEPKSKAVDTRVEFEAKRAFAQIGGSNATNVMISIRGGGRLDGKAFWLNNDYNWKLEYEYGVGSALMLVPEKK